MIMPLKESGNYGRQPALSYSHLDKTAQRKALIQEQVCLINSLLVHFIFQRCAPAA